MDKATDLASVSSEANQLFGTCLATTFDGAVAAICSPGSRTGAGSIFVFERDAALGKWQLQAQLWSRNATVQQLGSSVAMGTANMIVSGARSATLGHVLVVFALQNGQWVEQPLIRPTNGVSGDQFGSAVALSPDGSLLAVGAPGKSSSQGAVYTYRSQSGVWSQFAELSGAVAGDRYGAALAMSGTNASVHHVAELE
jgi:hypothetical protein